jgi:hypothetical protein
MGSSDDAETGATQAVANQISAAPCRCEWKSHSLVLRRGASFSPYSISRVCILWLDTYYSGLVLFSSFEGLGVGWQSTFSSVEYRLFE